MKKLEKQCKHTFEPIYDNQSRILILGSFPSVKSREGGFYYHHPRNRFWEVISNIFSEELPLTVNEKRELLLRNHIALWDVINRCDIEGSSDTSIKNVVPADINSLLKKTNIKKIYANGNKAYELYQKYCFMATNKDIIKLPSTSPANAAWTLERLCEEWKQIKEEGAVK